MNAFLLCPEMYFTAALCTRAHLEKPQSHDINREVSKNFSCIENKIKIQKNQQL